MKIARIVYLSMVRFRLLRLFMFIQKMDVRGAGSGDGTQTMQRDSADPTMK